MQNLGFDKIKKEDNNPFVLTEKQKELVEMGRRKAKENPEYMLDWEEVQGQIDWDAC